MNADKIACGPTPLDPRGRAVHEGGFGRSSTHPVTPECVPRLQLQSRGIYWLMCPPHAVWSVVDDAQRTDRWGRGEVMMRE